MLSHFLLDFIENKNNLPTLQVCLFLKEESEYGRVYKRASITVETALIFPLFISILLFLITPLQIMDTNRRVQYVSEVVARDAAQYAYTLSYKHNIRSEDKDLITNFASTAAISELVKHRIRRLIKDEKIIGLDAYETEYMQDGENIIIRISYAYKMPFDLFGFYGLRQSLVSYRRAWIGSMENEDSLSNNDTEEFVFIGKNMGRYHLDRKCHYIFNDLKKVSFDDIKDIRSLSGKKYIACSRCGKDIKGGDVYILPNGRVYHKDKECSAIASYVKRVKRKDVEYLGACQYCGLKH